MASSRSKSIELSEFTSFSVTPIDGNSFNRRITVAYKNPGDLNRDPPLLFKFNLSGQEPVEKPMMYSEERKQCELSLDVSNNVRGYFLINGSTPQVLNLELKDGEPYPWIYKDRSVPQGTLTRCLYRADGSISPLVSDAKDTTLEIGDRLVTVYLPPGYDPEKKPPYNLQITLDGDDLSNVPCGGHKTGGGGEEDSPKKTELAELREQNKVLAHEKWVLGQEKSQLYGQLKQLETCVL